MRFLPKERGEPVPEERGIRLPEKRGLVLKKGEGPLHEEKGGLSHSITLVFKNKLIRVVIFDLTPSKWHSFEHTYTYSGTYTHTDSNSHSR